MAKRFVDTTRYRQAWRKLDPKLRAAFYWLQENCDPAGYWTIDLEHFKFECGYALDIDKLIEQTGAFERHGKDALRSVDFIEVNYGSLREGYNPHKPALRAVALRQNLSLNQASAKLEEEDEEEDEDNSSGKERARATVPVEPRTEAERIARSKSSDLPFGSDAFSLAFADFEDMRKKIRHPMTPAARRMILQKLGTWTEAGAIAALNKSTVNSWRDVFPPKAETPADRHKATIAPRTQGIPNTLIPLKKVP